MVLLLDDDSLVVLLLDDGSLVVVVVSSSVSCFFIAVFESSVSASTTSITAWFAIISRILAFKRGERIGFVQGVNPLWLEL